jgi:hypothetical protein
MPNHLRTTLIGLATIASLAASHATRAEVVTLVCQTVSSASFILRVDYDRKMVDMPNDADLPNPVGTAFFSAAAQITELDVTWNVVAKDMAGHKFAGGVNRVTNQGFVVFPQKSRNGTVTSQRMDGPCSRYYRRNTAKINSNKGRQ